MQAQHMTGSGGIKEAQKHWKDSDVIQIVEGIFINPTYYYDSWQDFQLSIGIDCMHFQFVSGENEKIVDKEAIGGRVLRYLYIYAKRVRTGLYVITEPMVIGVYRRAVCLFSYNC